VGCWRRAYIRFADGTVDDASEVIWLQTRSAMADLRLDGKRPDLTQRGGLRDCTAADLIAMAGSDSSSGHTVVGCDSGGVVTATWHTGDDGVDFQPVTRFPEPGHLSWSADGRVMVERAPSGAYDEEWHRLDGSDGPCGHVVVDGRVGGGAREGWYVVGDHAMYVRDRSVVVDDDRRIDEQIAALDLDDAADRARAEVLVDCEFSYARRVGERWIVQLSTLPWLQESTLDMTPLAAVIGERTR
jgi:hypothetical protein